MQLRVTNPPFKPLLIWDGECDFCRLWIERWRFITAGEVDYATYQEVADRFPEIPRDEFKHAMVFIESDGTAFFAAEAVYRSLAYRPSKRWLAWSYDRVPGFAAISEAVYKFVAPHPVPASSSGTNWTRRLRSLADALLVQLEQRVSSFPLWWRRCSFVASDFRNCPGALARRAFRFLPVAHHRG